jgi:Baseplate J-like protein
MQTDNLTEQIDKLLDEVDGPDEPGISDEPITDGEFAELIEGEVIENPPKPNGVPIKWLIPVGLVSLALALVGVLVIAPLFAESATISITPDVQTVTATGDITLPARTLVHKTITLAEQVKTTGTAHQASTEAHGWVTFYNALQSPQTMPAGTLLVGADGIHVTTDGDAYIPSGTLATNGSATVSAHAAIVGIAGNIQAGDINGACCRDYVFAYNGAFSGGQDAREYTTATASDINTGSKELSSLITMQITTEAQKQLTSNEVMDSPQCQDKTVSTPKPGIEAAQVMVSVISDCSVYAYNRSDLTAQEQTLFTQAMNDQLGSGYAIVGNPHPIVTRTAFSKGTLLVSLTLVGKCVYHFQSSELQHIQQIAAGQSREQATALLLKLRGIHTVGIQIDNGKTTLPGNTQKIAISVYDKA